MKKVVSLTLALLISNFAFGANYRCKSNSDDKHLLVEDLNFSSKRKVTLNKNNQITILLGSNYIEGTLYKRETISFSYASNGSDFSNSSLIISTRPLNCGRDGCDDLMNITALLTYEKEETLFSCDEINND